MKLGFFTMPIHPLDKDWRLSLKEDREAFLLADELGFTEAYVGEHVTDRAENITSCIAFIAWLAAATKQIRLGTGTVNMPNTHPAAVAASIAMLDHMLDGRLIFGISPGGLLSDAEMFGNLDADRNAMFLEAINQVLEIWASEPPYNLQGKYWNISAQKTLIEDIGQGFIATPAAAAASADRRDRGGAVLKRRHRSGRARLGSDLGEFPDAGLGKKPLAEICRRLRTCRPLRRSRELARRQERVCRQGRSDREGLCHRPKRTVCLLLSLAVHQAEARRPPRAVQDPPRSTRRRSDAARSICDKLIIHGTPDSVADQLLAFQDEVGTFGTLLYAGKDWKDRELGRRSMILMAEKVMPRVNAGPRIAPTLRNNRQSTQGRLAVALTDRIPYQAQIDRPKLTLPGGKKLAVWVILNVEEWRIENAMPRTVLSPPMGQPLFPDVPNWSWHEYGMRAGFWRQFKALTDRNIPVTLAMNANVCNSYPRVASAALEAGFEFMGHGFVQGPMHKLDNQADAIKRAVETIAEFTGKSPRSWESPGLTETEETLDLLRLNGIEYVADWVIDDLPQDIATPHGTMTTIPYSVETNDIVIHALQHLPSEQFLRRCTDQFDRLYLEGARTRGSWRSRFIPTSPVFRTASNIWKLCSTMSSAMMASR